MSFDVLDRGEPKQTVIVVDTSVLINFLRIDRADLLAALPELLIVTDHVAIEISSAYAAQRDRFDRALVAKIVVEEVITDADEVDSFLRLGITERLGSGERSAIAVAVNRGHLLAMDDERAIREAVQFSRSLGRRLDVLRTQDLMVRLIRQTVLSVEEADRILADWAENHRYRRKFRTFADLL